MSEKLGKGWAGGRGRLRARLRVAAIALELIVPLLLLLHAAEWGRNPFLGFAAAMAVLVVPVRRRTGLSYARIGLNVGVPGAILASYIAAGPWPGSGGLLRAWGFPLVHGMIWGLVAAGLFAWIFHVVGRVRVAVVTEVAVRGGEPPARAANGLWLARLGQRASRLALLALLAVVAFGALLTISQFIGVEDTFVLADAGLAEPALFERPPPAYEDLSPEERRAADPVPVRGHRLIRATGTVIGYRWMARGSLSDPDMAKLRKLTVALPGTLATRGTVSLPKDGARAVYTDGPRRWPGRLCYGVARDGEIRYRRTDDGRYRVRVVMEVEPRSLGTGDCAPRTIRKRFTAAPITHDQLNPWLGCPGAAPGDELSPWLEYEGRYDCGGGGEPDTTRLLPGDSPTIPGQ